MSFQFFPNHKELTPNGKIDRKTLGQARQTEFARSQTRIPPRTPTEQFVADVWKEVLEVDEIAVQDNFFDLGGHSLLAMKVVFRVERKIGHKVFPIELLLQTLEQFAALCDKRAGHSAIQGQDRDGAPRGFFGRLRQRIGRAR